MDRVVVLCLGHFQGIPADVVSLGVTDHHIVTGHVSGHVHVYTRVLSAEVRLTASRVVTSRNNISLVSVSEDGNVICVGCMSGEVILLQLSHNRVTRYSFGQPVTCLSWARDTWVCVGGQGGGVALVSLLRQDIKQILNLESRVEQVDYVDHLGVLVSCTTGTYLCNIELKIFRQLSSEPSVGVCGNRDVYRQLVWNVTSDCHVSIVEADTGHVLDTCKYKSVLDNLQPSRIINKDGEIEKFPESPSEHKFYKLTSNKNNITLTQSQTGNIYLLDLNRSQVLAWWTAHPPDTIVEAHLTDSCVITLSSSGLVTFYKFGQLVHMLHNLYITLGNTRLEQFLNLELDTEKEILLFYFNFLALNDSGPLHDAVLNIFRRMLSLDVTNLSKSMSMSLPDRLHEENNILILTRTSSMKNFVVSLEETMETSDIVIHTEDNFDDEDNIGTDAMDTADNLFENLEMVTVDNLENMQGRGNYNFQFNKTQILSEMISSCQIILHETDDNKVTREISKLSQFLSKLLGNYFHEMDDNEQAPSHDEILVNLTVTQKQTLKECFNIIFSDELYCDLCFHPLKDILEENCPPRVSFASKQLVKIFDQIYLDQDYLLSAVVRYISPYIDVDFLLKHMDVNYFLTINELVQLEHIRKPILAPMTLEQIDENNIYDSINLLSKYPTLSVMDILRYSNHASQYDSDCSIHLLQNYTLEVPPVALFYFPLFYFDNLQKAVKSRISDDTSLDEAVHLEFCSVLVRCLSLHLPAWTERWKNIFHQHKNISTFMFEAFKIHNESRLSKTANLLGAHKSNEALETSSLGTFLMKHFQTEGMDPLSFCLKSSDMVGLARLSIMNFDIALENLPMLIELGDLDLLRSSSLLKRASEKIVTHLMTVYPPDGDTPTPIPWSPLANMLLDETGPEITRNLLMMAAKANCLPKGTLDAKFYSKLTLKSIINS